MSRVRPEDGPSISLFPFLAVLLCTMGALLVLLVLFSRSAKEGETPEQVRAREQEEADLTLLRDTLSWRLQQVGEIRTKTAEDLAKARLQLAGIEDHVRSLTDELKSLERAALALAAPGAVDAADDTEIARLEARLKTAKESLDEKRKELATKPPAYAVVPYVGSAGTHRRPLYIECCIDGVFLQPEGIRLGPSDFEGPPGPGNPLASALRAAREHIASTTAAGGDPAAQPYPLLLVRPSGVMAYYAAREAIQSWGSDFGYQLIDEDWDLAFPPRDPALAEVERRAVEESRERLAWLAQKRPARAARPVEQYRAATTRGGVVSSSGPSLLGDQSRWDWSRQQVAKGGGGGDGAGNGSGGPGAAANGQAVGDDMAGTSGPSSIFGSTPGGRASSAASSGGVVAVTGPGSDADRSPASSGTSGGDGNGSGQPGGSGRYGGGSSFGDVAAAAAGDSGSGGRGTSSQAAGGVSSATAAGFGGGGSGPSFPGMAKPGGSAPVAAGADAASGGSAASGSVAAARGRNWASLATADRPVPLTRPIHVECSLDELRIFDDTGRRVQTRIPLGPDTAAAVDPFVRAVHDRVAGWGLAGDRMYWNPQLVLSETADGRSRREDLERLLADSGLETRRKGHSGSVQPLPPVSATSAILTSP